MKNALILYKSRYGTTEHYALRTSELTGIPACRCEEVDNLSDYTLILHFGALYAGGMLGLKDTLRTLPQNSRLILVTVGLADPCDQGNVENICRSIARQVPEDVLKRTQLFHLRGGIDYSRLSVPHRTMMALLVQKAKRLPEEEQTAEVRAMLETYGKAVDFYDDAALQPILEAASHYE